MEKRMVQVRVPADIRAQVDKEAAQLGISASKLGRIFLTKGLKEMQGYSARAVRMVARGQAKSFEEAARMIRDEDS
ncbi:hypothetical protein [Pukyongiella litopenaei]|uniref:CopG family transcriptional regulator n=1 Tax=Pukyongiella litopenaei TaxID=2605946 RepID=A0A2S0MNM8_9RHOB|nr:hypothetical protein [Pukyongiella litopenaei]AVO37313.2 hypothetical protein C6Y53_06035 [Pukyongiella litopenaei]